MHHSTTKPANAAAVTAISTPRATQYLGSYLAWYHLAIRPKLPTPRSVLAPVAGLTPLGQPVCIDNAN